MSSRFAHFLDQAGEVIFPSSTTTNNNNKYDPIKKEKNDDTNDEDDDENTRNSISSNNKDIKDDDDDDNTSNTKNDVLPSLLPLTSEDRASMRRMIRCHKSISVNELKELWKSSSSLFRPCTTSSNSNKVMRNKDQIASDHSSTIIIFSICLWITCMSAYAYIASHRTGDHRVFDN